MLPTKEGPSESEILRALGDWATDNLPGNYTIRQGQINRSKMPFPPFAIMQIIWRRQLSTMETSYYTDETGNSVERNEISLEMCLQFQTFGPTAGDDARRLASRWRTASTCDWFMEHMPCMAPLDYDDPHQVPYINAEKAYENNWATDLRFNVIHTMEYAVKTADKLALHKVNGTEMGFEVSRPQFKGVSNERTRK